MKQCWQCHHCSCLNPEYRYLCAKCATTRSNSNVPGFRVAKKQPEITEISTEVSPVTAYFRAEDTSPTTTIPPPHKGRTALATVLGLPASLLLEAAPGSQLTSEDEAGVNTRAQQQDTGSALSRSEPDNTSAHTEKGGKSVNSSSSSKSSSHSEDDTTGERRRRGPLPAVPVIVGGSSSSKVSTDPFVAVIPVQAARAAVPVVVPAFLENKKHKQTTRKRHQPKVPTEARRRGSKVGGGAGGGGGGGGEYQGTNLSIVQQEAQQLLQEGKVFHCSGLVRQAITFFKAAYGLVEQATTGNGDEDDDNHHAACVDIACAVLLERALCHLALQEYDAAIQSAETALRKAIPNWPTLQTQAQWVLTLIKTVSQQQSQPQHQHHHTGKPTTAGPQLGTATQEQQVDTTRSKHRKKKNMTTTGTGSSTTTSSNSSCSSDSTTSQHSTSLPLSTVTFTIPNHLRKPQQLDTQQSNNNNNNNKTTTTTTASSVSTDSSTPLFNYNHNHTNDDEITSLLAGTTSTTTTTSISITPTSNRHTQTDKHQPLVPLPLVVPLPLHPTSSHNEHERVGNTIHSRDGTTRSTPLTATTASSPSLTPPSVTTDRGITPTTTVAVAAGAGAGAVVDVRGGGGEGVISSVDDNNNGDDDVVIPVVPTTISKHDHESTVSSTTTKQLGSESSVEEKLASGSITPTITNSTGVQTSITAPEPRMLVSIASLPPELVITCDAHNIVVSPGATAQSPTHQFLLSSRSPTPPPPSPSPPPPPPTDSPIPPSPSPPPITTTPTTPLASSPPTTTTTPTTVTPNSTQLPFQSPLPRTEDATAAVLAELLPNLATGATTTAGRLPQELHIYHHHYSPERHHGHHHKKHHNTHGHKKRYDPSLYTTSPTRDHHSHKSPKHKKHHQHHKHHYSYPSTTSSSTTDTTTSPSSTSNTPTTVPSRTPNKKHNRTSNEHHLAQQQQQQQLQQQQLQQQQLQPQQHYYHGDGTTNSTSSDTGNPNSAKLTKHSSSRDRPPPQHDSPTTITTTSNTTPNTFKHLHSPSSPNTTKSHSDSPTTPNNNNNNQSSCSSSSSSAPSPLGPLVPISSTSPSTRSHTDAIVWSCSDDSTIQQQHTFPPSNYPAHRPHSHSHPHTELGRQPEEEERYYNKHESVSNNNHGRSTMGTNPNNTTTPKIGVNKGTTDDGVVKPLSTEELVELKKRELQQVLDGRYKKKKQQQQQHNNDTTGERHVDQWMDSSVNQKNSTATHKSFSSPSGSEGTFEQNSTQSSVESSLPQFVITAAPSSSLSLSTSPLPQSLHDNPPTSSHPTQQQQGEEKSSRIGSGQHMNKGRSNESTATTSSDSDNSCDSGEKQHHDKKKLGHKEFTRLATLREQALRAQQEEKYRKEAEDRAEQKRLENQLKLFEVDQQKEILGEKLGRGKIENDECEIRVHLERVCTLAKRDAEAIQATREAQEATEQAQREAQWEREYEKKMQEWAIVEEAEKARSEKIEKEKKLQQQRVEVKQWLADAKEEDERLERERQWEEEERRKQEEWAKQEEQEAARRKRSQQEAEKVRLVREKEQLAMGTQINYSSVLKKSDANKESSCEEKKPPREKSVSFYGIDSSSPNSTAKRKKTLKRRTSRQQKTTTQHSQGTHVTAEEGWRKLYMKEHKEAEDRASVFVSAITGHSSMVKEENFARTTFHKRWKQQALRDGWLWDVQDPPPVDEHDYDHHTNANFWPWTFETWKANKEKAIEDSVNAELEAAYHARTQKNTQPQMDNASFNSMSAASISSSLPDDEACEDDDDRRRRRLREKYARQQGMYYGQDEEEEEEEEDQYWGQQGGGGYEGFQECSDDDESSSSADNKGTTGNMSRGASTRSAAFLNPHSQSFNRSVRAGSYVLNPMDIKSALMDTISDDDLPQHKAKGTYRKAVVGSDDAPTTTDNTTTDDATEYSEGYQRRYSSGSRCRSVSTVSKASIASTTFASLPDAVDEDQLLERYQPQQQMQWGEVGKAVAKKSAVVNSWKHTVAESKERRSKHQSGMDGGNEAAVALQQALLAISQRDQHHTGQQKKKVAKFIEQVEHSPEISPTQSLSHTDSSA